MVKLYINTNIASQQEINELLKMFEITMEFNSKGYLNK